MNWSKKTEQFALSCKIRGASRLLAHYIINRAKKNEICELEIDLHDFNSWIERHRILGKYHRKTVINAIAFLDEHSQGMFVILKKYSPWVYKLLVRPLEIVLRMKSAKRALIPKADRGNPMYSEEHKERLVKQQQQDISKIDDLLNAVGLKYDRDALTRIYRLAGKKIEPVVKAIELMLYRHSSTAITKAHGFIIQCLKGGWQENFDIYYEPELPKFESRFKIAEFVDSICNPSQLQTSPAG